MKVEVKALALALSGVAGALASDYLSQAQGVNPLYIAAGGAALIGLGWFLDHEAGLYLIGAGAGMVLDAGLRYAKVIS